MTNPDESIRGLRPHVGAWKHEHGTLREMTDRLRDLAAGWDHLGKGKTAQECRRAAEALEQGSFAVRVGATTYNVTDR